MRYRFGGLIFGGAYTWRGLFSEFYGIINTANTKRGRTDKLEEDCNEKFSNRFTPNFARSRPVTENPTLGTLSVVLSK